MPGRQHTTPLLLQGGHADLLVRVPFYDRHFSEDDLQRLLFEHPSVLPIDEIEPVFGPLIPLARELPTEAGPIDLVYISPGGWPTLVETKLWRNPEARRQAVAQILDYASAVSRWSYSQFAAAVQKTAPAATGLDPLAEAVRQEEEAFDEKHFTDTVARNLERGRLLLLIVGDGIQEGLEQLAQAMGRTPQLGFTLALVELALFRRAAAPEPVIVQPRVIARTREVIRAVVELRRPDISSSDVVVSIPAEENDQVGSGKRTTLTAEAFYEKLATNQAPAVVAELRTFLEQLNEHGIDPVWRQGSVSLLHREPRTGAEFSAGSIWCKDGAIDMWFVPHRFEKKGLNDAIAQEYLDRVAALVPGAKVHRSRGKSGAFAAIKVGRRHITVAELLPHKKDWFAAIDQFLSKIHSAVEALEDSASS